MLITKILVQPAGIDTATAAWVDAEVIIADDGGFDAAPGDEEKLGELSELSKD